MKLYGKLADEKSKKQVKYVLANSVLQKKTKGVSYS